MLNGVKWVTFLRKWAKMGHPILAALLASTAKTDAPILDGDINGQYKS
jgi:hypothetical protein